MASSLVPITAAHGGGIGPDVTTRKTLDHRRAGFVSEEDKGPVFHGQIVTLLDRIQKAVLDFINVENLYTSDGQKGFVASQSE